MDSNSITTLMMGWQSKIPAESGISLQEKLKEIPDDKMQILSAIQLKSHVVGLVLGILFGGLALDRFYKGDYLIGGIKLGTCILYFILGMTSSLTWLSGFLSLILTIWIIIDLFLVWRGIKKDNLVKIQNIIYSL